jgi:hypothetical protein
MALSSDSRSRDRKSTASPLFLFQLANAHLQELSLRFLLRQRPSFLISSPSLNCPAEPAANICAGCMRKVTFFFGLLTASNLAIAGARPPKRRVFPIRDPHTFGFVKATELPDGTNPPPKKDGNFIIGPTHKPAPIPASIPLSDSFRLGWVA